MAELQPNPISEVWPQKGAKFTMAAALIASAHRGAWFATHGEDADVARYVMFRAANSATYSDMGGTPMPRGTGVPPVVWVHPRSYGEAHSGSLQLLRQVEAKLSFPRAPRSTTGQSESNPHAAPASQGETALAMEGIWRVVVLNDPVNLMSYVVMVFKKVFGFDDPTARRHMLEVHEQGRSIVWSGLREKAEAYAFTLQQWHLTAVLELDEAH